MLSRILHIMIWPFLFFQNLQEEEASLLWIFCSFLWSQQDSCHWIWFHTKKSASWVRNAYTSSVYLWLVYHFLEIHGTFEFSEIYRVHGYVQSRFLWFWISLKMFIRSPTHPSSYNTCRFMLSSNIHDTSWFRLLLHTFCTWRNTFPTYTFIHVCTCHFPVVIMILLAQYPNV